MTARSRDLARLMCNHHQTVRAIVARHPATVAPAIRRKLARVVLKAMAGLPVAEAELAGLPQAWAVEVRTLLAEPGGPT